MIAGGAPTLFCPFGRELMSLHPQDSGSDSSKSAAFPCPETEFGRDLFRGEIHKALRAVSLDDKPCRERWQMRLGPDGEEELFASDCTITWSKTDGRGSAVLIKSFTPGPEVRDETWCVFPQDDQPLQCIVANTGRMLDVFVETGEHLPVAPAFRVSRVVPSSSGLLIVRSILPSDDNSRSLPALFSLSHPLKDIAPVMLRSFPKLPQGISVFAGDGKYQLIAACPAYALVILFNRFEGTHSVWHLRDATDDEITSLMSSNDSSVGLAAESPFGSFKHQFNHSTQSVFSPLRNCSLTKQFSSPSLSRITGSHSMSSPSVSFSSLKNSKASGNPSSPLLRSFGSPPATSSPKVAVSPDTQRSKTLPLDSPSFKPINSTPRAFEYDAEDLLEPIYPEQCMELLWTEPHPSSSTAASKVFVSTDLIGQTHLVFHLSQQQTAKIVKFDSSNSGLRLIFGSITNIMAVDVEPVPTRNMLIVLEPSHSLVLYSGCHRVSVIYLPAICVSNLMPAMPNSPRECRRHSSFVYLSPTTFRRTSVEASSRAGSSLSSHPRFSVDGVSLSPVANDSSRLFENSDSQLQVNNVTSLRDGVNDRVTAEDREGQLFRFSLPPIASSSAVKMCITSLKAVLPKEIRMQMMMKWYSFRNSSTHCELTDDKELFLFKRCLLSLIGYEVENLNMSSSLLTSASFEVAKKVKMEVDERGCDDDWIWLQEHRTSASRDTLMLDNILTPTPSSILFPFLPYLMYSLHLTYEEMKLHSLLHESVPQLLEVLFLFASDLRRVLYQDHYWRDFPTICSQMNSASRIPEADVRTLSFPNYFTETPPSAFAYLQSLLQTENYTQVSPYPLIPASCPRSRALVLLFASIRNEQVSEKTFLHPIQMPCKGNTAPDDVCTQGIRKREERIVTTMDKLGMRQHDLQSVPAGISLILWESTFECRKDPSSDWSNSCYALIGRSDLLTVSANQMGSKPMRDTESEAEEDGLLSLNKNALKLLFPEDQRVSEAYNMLQSSKPVRISVAQRPGVTDNEFIEEQERHLYSICIRTMALSVGRGMLTLRTYKPVIAENFPIPKLCLTGRVPPRSTAVELSHIDVPPNMNTWPLFHNGVAAGLRACLLASDVIDSSWIIYNRPKSLLSSLDAQNEHAGFLLALGLNGHLAKLSRMNIHDYLWRGNELTRVAVLLGLAAARRGTMDPAATKVLSIHVEALLPPTSTELDIPPIVQVAAVLGIGLLYQGSGQGHIAETLLGEIGRPPGPEMEHYIDRESYALAAGLAFGLVTLGKGNQMISAASVSPDSSSMSDQLYNFMIGGHKKALTTAQKEKYKTPSYQIREGDYVNADVTSPGATLALGMLFFDTGNQAVAKWVTAPDTQYLLETVRPDFLLLRTLAKGLILWSSVAASKDWVDSHIPAVVKEYAFQRHEDFNPRIDYETMSQAYCNIVAGACMAMGLRFAGTADKQVFKVILGYTNMFLSLPNRQQAADQAGRSTIESCLNVLVISLSLIMAGTGNLEVMRICRFLRSRTSQVNVVLYGSHIATHMALGLLFLGGCRYSISTKPEAVAALICALFPKFPIHSNDNRYHLQAFRHLYVLAVEPRLVIPRDIDSGEFVYVHLRFRLRQRQQADQPKLITVRAPCLVPELDLLQEVIVDDPRYWKMTFERSKNWATLISFLTTSGVISVKKKIGCLSYAEDSKGFKSIHSQNAMKDAVKGWGSTQPPTVSHFASDTIVSRFCSLVLSPKAVTSRESEIQQMICAFLVDCASSETIECLHCLMELERRAKQASEGHNSLSLWQLKLAISGSKFCRSMRGFFVEGLRNYIDSKVKAANGKELVKYLRGEISLSEGSAEAAEALLVYEMPPYASLSPLQEKVWSFPDLVSNLRHFSLPMATLVLLSEALR